MHDSSNLGGVSGTIVLAKRARNYLSTREQLTRNIETSSKHHYRRALLSNCCIPARVGFHAQRTHPFIIPSRVLLRLRLLICASAIVIKTTSAHIRNNAATRAHICLRLNGRD